MEIGTVLGLTAAAMGLLFTILVFIASGRTVSGRNLAALLLVETVVLGSFALSDLVQGTVEGEALVVAAFIAGLGLCALYPWILRELRTPYTNAFRNPTFLRVWTGVFVIDGLVLAALSYTQLIRGERLPEDSPLIFLAVPAFLFIFLLSVLAFFASVWAFRHADEGANKERARAFVIAFGCRDIMYVLSIGSNFASDLFPEPTREIMLDVSGSVTGAGFILFVPLLAYGILRTQLFDLDLKIKLGIKRGTVVGIILGAFFAVAKITEAYLSREVGFVAGSIIAGLMLFAVPKLNKVGEKVANTTMPTVQATPVYVQFKKLEVYRAAVESAHETGGVTPKERASLDKLRSKLGILDADALAVEAEILSAGPQVVAAANAEG